MSGWHVCPGPDCQAEVQTGKLFCSACWDDVPAKLQERIADLWGKANLTQELLRAVEYAVKRLGADRCSE